MKIPTKSYPLQYQQLWPELQHTLHDLFFSDDPVLGTALECFEQQLATYHHVSHAVGVGSGTDALVLALKELGIGANDEVITCSHTFSGVISAILLAGATPVLCEPDITTGLIDLSRLPHLISKRTKAIVAVHLYGHPVDLDQLVDYCHQQGLLLIEDAAQAHGGRWRGRPLGSFGKVAILSFHPSKNLGAFGDGGAILCHDEELAEGLKVARNLGKSDKYTFSRVSINSKLDTLQAAILTVKLRHLETWLTRRRALAQRYQQGLQGIEGLVLPHEDKRAQAAYHLFVVRTQQRESLRKFLAERSIKTSLHYPIAAPEQPALQRYFANQTFPLARHIAEQVLTLPLSHEHEDTQIDEVIEAIHCYFQS